MASKPLPAGLKTGPEAARRFQDTGPGPVYAWYVVLVLMGVYALSFANRQILSLLVQPIKRDLALSDTEISLLQGLAFAVFYTLMGLPLGRLADTRNRKNLIGACVAVWSFFTAACSAAASFWSLFLARLGVGIGEAGTQPASFSLISDLFPEERLGIALAVLYMGAFIGSGLMLTLGGWAVDAVTHMSPVIMPLLGTVAPWRFTFLIVAAPGIPFALLAFFLREPMRRSLLRTTSGEVSRLSLSETFAQVLPRWQSVAGISLMLIFQATCLYGFLNWAPTFFVRVHHWTIGEIGQALGLVVLIFGCAGMVVGGRLSDRWLRKGIAAAPLLVMVPGAIGTAVLFPFAFTATSPVVAMALIAPALFFLALPMSPAVAAIQLIFPNQLRAQVSAFMLFCLNLGGLSLGPLAPALLNDYVFKNGAMVGASLALTLGIASVLMLAICLLTIRPYRMHYRLLHPV